MIWSKASTDRGKGSGGAAGSGLSAGESTIPPPANPFVAAGGPSTEVAMSSSLEVAASSLVGSVSHAVVNVAKPIESDGTRCY